MPLCNLLWNRKVIIPMEVLLFCSFSHHPLLEHCDFNSVRPGRMCFIPSARSARNMFPSLGISRTVSCIVKLSLSYLKGIFPQGIRFLQCAWWEHCVKHRTASNKFTFPHPLSGASWKRGFLLLQSVPLRLSHTHPHLRSAGNKTCVLGRGQNGTALSRRGRGKGVSPEPTEHTCGKVGANEVSSVCPSVWNSF